MKISLIVAHDENFAIGKDGNLPWYLPDDFKWFKKNTINKMIVMGRTTWNTLQVQPLPKRINLVMTTDQSISFEGAIACNSLQEVLTISNAKKCDELMIIGGSQIYELFFPLADQLIVTKVHTEIEKADAFFVKYDAKNWYLDFEEFHSKDNKHAFDFSFHIWKKKVVAE